MRACATTLAVALMPWPSCRPLASRPFMMCTTPAVPTSAVGLDGGDTLSGLRANRSEVADIVEEALSSTVRAPIIAQYYPGRKWLWRQWGGTVVRRTLPREVLLNCVLASILSLIFSKGSPFGAKWVIQSDSYLAGLARAWTLSATMASFMLSFFLSQSYALWRSAYGVTRRVQGRLNDIGLLSATFAERDRTNGQYTPAADELLCTIARYVRLFHLLFYASVTTRFAPLKTPKGLSALVSVGALTAEEREVLLESSTGHNAVVGWLSVLVDTAISDGRLATSVVRARDTSPIAVQMSLQNKLLDLRATYASLEDELTGRSESATTQLGLFGLQPAGREQPARLAASPLPSPGPTCLSLTSRTTATAAHAPFAVPLAYVQLVQILTDGLILVTPFALIRDVGQFGVVCATFVVTLFYSSIVTLAKLFLDPFNNEVQQRGGDPGIGGIEVATLLQETNLGSERWRRSAANVPSSAWQPFQSVEAEDTAEAEPEQSLVARVLGAAAAAAVAKPDASTEHAASKRDRDGSSSDVESEG